MRAGRLRPALAARLGVLSNRPFRLPAHSVPLPLPFLMLAAALAVLSIVVGNVFWETMEQQEIPNEAISRVDSISWMVSLVIMPLDYLVAGPISHVVGVRATRLRAAAISASSLVAALSTRSIRELRRRESTPTSLEVVAVG